MTITLDKRQDGTWHVTLDRPDRANALSVELVEALHGVLDEAAGNPPAALVLQGNRRHFCAGFDLSALDSETDGSLAHRFLRVGLLLERLLTAPYTTVAVVEGAAVGAGADLVAACEQRVGTPEATFQFPGSAFGVILGRQRLADLVGEDTGRELASGERIDAERAVEIGLLRSLVRTRSVEPEVQRVVSKVTRTLPRLADGTHDLAALARSVSVPGLRDRIAAYAGASGLSPRAFDRNGELQMAESSLAAHTASGTPVDDLFLVHHYTRPDLSGADKLEIVGRDGNVATVSHDQIRALPRREVVAVLECAGNGRGHLAARAPGNQFGLGLFAQNRWAGASLADVLALAGIRERDVTQLVVEGADEGLTAPENTHDRFAKGLPAQKALHPDTLLAWQLEEDPVPHAHGGPLRLVVPGWYGIWWVKWPSRLRVADEEFTGIWQHQRYTYQADDGTVLSLVRELRPRAVLCSPTAGERALDPVLDILAWAGEHRVASVDFTVDDGTTWLPAERVAEHGRWGWTRWTGRLPESLPRGLRRVAVRATDDAGRAQNWQPEPNRLGYGNNGIHSVQVELVAAAPADGRQRS